MRFLFDSLRLYFFKYEDSEAPIQQYADARKYSITLAT